MVILKIIKDRDYLKQPMAVTVTISLDELTDSNLLLSNSDQEPIRKQINFGMRDFKIFEFSQFFTTPSSSSERLDENYVTTANNDYFHIFSETLEILYYLIYKITNIQKFNSFKSLLRINLSYIQKKLTQS